jgi:hypothetical protein
MLQSLNLARLPISVNTTAIKKLTDANITNYYLRIDPYEKSKKDKWHQNEKLKTR